MAASPSASHALTEPNVNVMPAAVSVPRLPSMWNSSAQRSPGFDSHHEEHDDYSFHSSSHITDKGSHRFWRRELDLAGVPRTWEQYNPRLFQENTLPSFSHGYNLGNERDIHGRVQAYKNNGDEMDFSPVETSQQYPSLGMGQTAMQIDEFVRRPTPTDFISADGLPFDKPTPFSMPSSSVSEDGNIYTAMTPAETDEQGVEEPYARLIYRALLSAPNHSMVLQEIYQWFRDNTSKGSSESKGWMNSIRHNLSMNAAFKKTERMGSGEDTKKSTEWVLEDFAIKDGVQSTTRYRKGTANRRIVRSESPALRRQRSGRRRGTSAAAAAKNTSTRYRRRSHTRRSSLSRLDASCSQSRLQNHSSGQSHSHYNDDRQSSQLTLPHLGAPAPGPAALTAAEDPYYVQKLEQGYNLDYEDLYGLEDVQGVSIDDSPLFASDHDDLDYHVFPLMSNHEA